MPPDFRLHWPPEPRWRPAASISATVRSVLEPSGRAERSGRRERGLGGRCLGTFSRWAGSPVGQALGGCLGNGCRSGGGILHQGADLGGVVGEHTPPAPRCRMMSASAPPPIRTTASASASAVHARMASRHVRAKSRWDCSAVSCSARVSTVAFPRAKGAARGCAWYVPESGGAWVSLQFSRPRRRRANAGGGGGALLVTKVTPPARPATGVWHFSRPRLRPCRRHTSGPRQRRSQARPGRPSG